MRTHKTIVHETRINRIRQKFFDLRIEGVLFFNMMNIRYLSGFTGSDGALFVGLSTSVLLVDGRYITQAKMEVSHCEVYEYRDKTDGIASVISDSGLKTVGFESSALTCDKYFDLSEKMQAVTFKSLAPDLASVRAVKDSAEIEKIQQASAIASRAFTSIMEAIKPGKVERDIAVTLEMRMRDLGSEKPSFETIVASGHNASLPHARPGSRKIENGDFVVVDYGAVYEGYHSDETCTVAVGSVSHEQKDIYTLVKTAHDKALDAVKEGVSCRKIDEIAREWIDRAGYGQYFSHGTGHGVGLEVHEAPTIFRKSTDYLQSGMIVTIEPGIYIPGIYGVRIEDMVMVERDGCKILSGVPKELKILDV